MKKWALAVAMVAVALIGMTSTARSDMGIGLYHEGGGIAPDMGLNIRGSSLLIRLVLGFDMVDSGDEDEEGLAASASNIYSVGGTQLRALVAIEKPGADMGGVTPHFGGRAGLAMNSPDPEGLDSWMDMVLGVYVGASANLTDNFSISGNWGPNVWLLGEQTASSGSAEVVLAPSRTNIGSSAWFTLDWNGIWGSK